MSANLIREIWRLVEETQSSTLLKLDDGELLSTLLRRLTKSQALSLTEANAVRTYLHSRLSLIRDLALSRVEEEASWEMLAGY
jgi:hypothetical protein